jgi:hypothetical protein
MVVTLYNVKPLQKALRESTYARLSDLMSVYAGFRCSVHGEKTSGLTLSYDTDRNKNKTDEELKTALLAFLDGKAPVKQNPLLQRAMAALKVLTLTPGTLAYLETYDPMGLHQANDVLAALQKEGVCANCKP